MNREICGVCGKPKKTAEMFCGGLFCETLTPLGGIRRPKPPLPRPAKPKNPDS